MDESTRAVIAEVTATSPVGPVRGTGFLVAHDLVATALHNVADRDPEDPVFFQNINLQFPGHATAATPVKWNRTADCMLLRCTDPPPSAANTPLALRALHRSGGEWETYGYANMQPADGLTVSGDVTNHAGELFGGPAIQLYSKQLAGGIGGDARGLSGGPVLMRDVVVGLMRFALGDEDHTIGGVVYACPAKFFADLDPVLSVQEMPTVQTVLLDDQVRELVPIYVKEFSAGDNALGTIVKYSLGLDLDQVTNPDQQFETIVTYLLTWANQQGAGPMEALLNATLRSRPANNDLRELCRKYAPDVLNPIDIGGLIFKAIRALELLSALVRTSAPANAIANSYRGDVQIILQQVHVVEQYKALHGILHNLQFKLEAIDLALRLPATDVRANASLERFAEEIRDYAQDAEERIRGLDTEQVEMGWINALKARSEEMLEVADPAASMDDRGQVYTTLRSVVTTAAPQINRSLAEAAGKLGLLGLTSMIDEVVCVENPNPAESQDLMNGAAAIGAVRICVAGLIKEHFAWQAVSTEVEGAKNSIRHQPQGKIFQWPLFEKRLRALCGMYPEELWSKRLLDRLDKWIGATPNAQPDATEREQGKIALHTFSGSCDDRFYRLDESVKAMSEKIVQLAPSLNRLLGALTP
ncbi:trypsin-like peptidase domain-containing protein [Bradyrhizobium sp. 61]|uniref:effector-associated domain EAD1-containing protein n=1 Tax=unclassified Bradyrhizobium TaxID=2631580 RepID=UPI001FF9D1C7|nr:MULTISPECIES: effector-associated domain EAD1-containing protein [unclassified Bradyrhizobium]MCK1274108.1 trypsin-like peptidase domain-containing protein [Bradyrhizobium sp. 61]MCK1447468.1 trypsin-like peptidase domain-containing protein [Bradyrhizobium sp. 48]MCK1462804.1 trypsin-like peptidase domain-containing protein [Bradyrhizobium sp. 2]